MFYTTTDDQAGVIIIGYLKDPPPLMQQVNMLITVDLDKVLKNITYRGSKYVSIFYLRIFRKIL